MRRASEFGHQRSLLFEWATEELKTIFHSVFHRRQRSKRRGTATSIAVWAAFFAVFLALFTAIFVVFRAVGLRSVPTNPPSNVNHSGAGTRVTGPSMAPALWGPHAELTCPACKNSWKVHWQPEHRPEKPIACWNCGAAVPIADAIELPGDRILIRELEGRPLVQGELVAIQDDDPSLDTQSSKWIVKRIAAVPGQTISCHNGWLLAHDKPLFAVEPSGQTLWFRVHDDSFRNLNQSWWQQRDNRPGIEQTASGFLFRASDSPTPWLDYYHFAVHDAMRPDVVRDDVPGNASEVRALVPIDPLSLTFAAETTTATEIEVAFHIEEQTETIRHKLPPGKSIQRLSSATAASTASPIAADSQIAPISIRLLGGQAIVSNLVVWRPLRYRIDPRIAATQKWPIHLGDDDYYLLGDNVPLSIDSRDWGPIPRRRIVGRIDAVGYDGK